MNILFFTRLFWPHVGGVEKHVHEIGKRLVALGIPVGVITTKHDARLKDHEFIDGIEIYRFKQPKIKFVGLLYTWFWLFAHIGLVRKSRLVHCHDVFIWYLPFRFLFPTKPIFTTFHGWEGKYPVPLKFIIHKKIAATLSNKTLSIGKFIKKYYKIKKTKVSYGATAIPEKHYKKDKNKIVYVGRLAKDTGLPVLLATIDLLNSYKEVRFQVDFCGDGELRKECAKYGKVHGFVDPRLFLAAYRFSFCSGYLTILDALANGSLVVTAYDNELKKDYFTDTPFHNFIVSSNDPDVLAQKILYYYLDENAYQNTIARGYNWVKTQTWENLVKDYISLWKPKKE